MPWTVLASIDQWRHRRRALRDRTQGACHDGIDALITRAGATLRRRGTEDMAAIAQLLNEAAHCVPCISLTTGLDARRIYAALERLNAEINVELLRSTCGRCTRATTVYLIRS
jgi:hypothetical protein